MNSSNQDDDVRSQKRREIGVRLRAERERLGLTQQQLAEMLGVQRQALLLYESGERTPLAEKLWEFDRVGGDVNFVVTGRRAGELDDDHKEELELAMSTVVLMCRSHGTRRSEVELLRLAMKLTEEMRRSREPGFSEAKVFATLRKSIGSHVG
jgi:transcriptional regulator with XRE-family HTH domain